MIKTFHVDIVSPAKIIYSQEAVSLVVPAELGYLGVLADHEPLLAHLVKGKIILRDGANQAKVFHLNGQGFLEVAKNKATIILDSLADETNTR